MHCGRNRQGMLGLTKKHGLRHLPLDFTFRRHLLGKKSPLWTHRFRPSTWARSPTRPRPSTRTRLPRWSRPSRRPRLRMLYSWIAKLLMRNESLGEIWWFLNASATATVLIEGDHFLGGLLFSYPPLQPTHRSHLVQFF